MTLLLISMITFIDSLSTHISQSARRGFTALAIRGSLFSITRDHSTNYLGLFLLVSRKKSIRSRSDSYITPRSTNYSGWYNDVIQHSELEEDCPIRGCRILKPYGLSVWNLIREDLAERLSSRGAKDACFPLLIPASFLSQEAKHIHGFAKECAIVTHTRLEQVGGDITVDEGSQLNDPLVVRPTSEAMIWSIFKKWIVSYRDLPIRVNQWANVLRWEKRTRPFLRTSEFLWQEGHTAHARPDEAFYEARSMLTCYSSLCSDLLALPTVMGIKSPSERFAGAQETFTLEALMPNGWALQSGTSHCLGQEFGKAFGVTFSDKKGLERTVWGSSWGVSTRLIGALVMCHGDDNGLVLPPRIAPIQIVIVPIYPNLSTSSTKKEKIIVNETIKSINLALDFLSTELNDIGLRTKVDNRENVRIGVKYFEWERKGVPLRIELGYRDVQNGVCVFKYRIEKKVVSRNLAKISQYVGLSNKKLTIALNKAAIVAKKGLVELQSYLLTRAEMKLRKGIRLNSSYQVMKNLLKNDEARIYPGAGLFLVPWRCNATNEAIIKRECKATIRCYPVIFNDDKTIKGKRCFYSGEPATHMALFGRSF